MSAEGQGQQTGGISVARPEYYEAIHCYRKVKTYPIQEHELSALDEGNVNFTLWSSIGTGFGFLVVSCIWDMICDKIYDGPRFFFVALFACLAAASFWLSLRYKAQCKSRLDKIMEEVTETPP